MFCLTVFWKPNARCTFLFFIPRCAFVLYKEKPSTVYTFICVQKLPCQDAALQLSGPLSARHWGVLPNSERKKWKFVVWASLLLHFIFCQKSPRFTRQYLDQGHLLGFVDLHGCPDVSNPLLPPSPTRTVPKCVSSLSPTPPPPLSCCLPATPQPGSHSTLCPWGLTNYSLTLPPPMLSPSFSFVVFACALITRPLSDWWILKRRLLPLNT